MIEKLSSDRSWSIGADARPCHTLSTPAWSPDGTRLRLIATYPFNGYGVMAAQPW